MSKHLKLVRRQPSSRVGDKDRFLRFSFRYFDPSHPAFDIERRGGDYFRLLLVRLRELSALRIEEFYSNPSRTLRIHKIDFRDSRVSVKRFGIPNALEADANGWQFSLSANEHGRVHGFLVEDTFFVRWLDPHHNLYS